MIYIGIDPGQAGGLALIDGVVNCVTAIKMPNTESDIWHWFSKVGNSQCFAIIERVHSMPGQGVASTFKFGQGYGGLRMALIAAGIPFEEVSPRSWQKYLNVTSRDKMETKTEFKNRLKAKAQQLFPQFDVTLMTSDAILIAEYNRRSHRN